MKQKSGATVLYTKVATLGFSLLAACGILFPGTANAQPEKETTESTTAKNCVALLQGESGVDEFSILAETHTLEELIAANPAENLVYLHPGSVMEAHQILAAWIRDAGVKRIPNPYYGAGFVNWYEIFHGGKYSKRRIVGQYPAVQEVVTHIQEAAAGDGSASKMALLWGPHGTGKTEFLEIAIEFARRITTENPDHYLYTYRWKNLRGIPEVYPVLNIQGMDKGGEFEHPMPCPLNHDAFVLLPKTYQDQLLQLAAPRVIKLAGVNPRPDTQPCPLCHEIRKAVVLHEMKALNRSLTTEEQVRVLSKHLEIVRLVPGMGGFESKINAEGKNIQWSELGAQPNNFLKEQFGSNHPFSYFYGGKLIRANRLFIFFDEFFRNDFPLRDFTLEYVENGKVARGGAPVVQVNAVKLSASNTESIERAVATGEAKAHLDRTKRIPMWWQTHPMEIAETMLIMKTRNDPNRLLMTPLTPIHKEEEAVGARQETRLDEEQPENSLATPAPADFRKLFLLDENGGTNNRLTGPDGRYRLDMVSGAAEPPVHISPHALELMAYTAAATRLVVDPQEALKFGNFESTVTRPEFYDAVTRLKVMTGQLATTTALRNDLLELGKFLKEGTAGISARNLAHDWLTGAIAEARLPENRNCISPEVAKKVFLKLLQTRAIDWKDNQTLLKWQQEINLIVYHFTIPSLVNDVMKAIGKDEGIIEASYLAVYYELLELARKPDATEYETWNGETRKINLGRLKEIKALYAAHENRELEPGELFNFHGRYQAKPGNRRHNGLEKVIIWYEAQHSGMGGGLEKILAYARTQRGTVEERDKFTSFFHNMSNHLGYCPVCARAAGEITIEHESGQTHLFDSKLFEKKKPTP